MSRQIEQIDPRGPRFGAAIINVFSIIIFFLALDKTSESTSLAILSIVWFSFFWGTTFGNTKHPFGIIYKTLVRPRLSAPKELEDARPPRFAQLVGLVVTSIGFLLAALAVPFGIAIAAAALFAASTLQAYFGYCLGCQIYLGLRRAGIIRG
jgi:sterol desaturase/sphingolipid hydroxylase (fatty acid hydroxylase superfamily)